LEGLSINWITAGKIVFTIIAFTFSIIGIYIVFNIRRWHTTLVLMEHHANLMRDDAMFNMTAFRASLETAKSKITDAENKVTGLGLETVFNNKFVMDQAISVLKLFLQKEKSIFQIGSIGLNVAKALWKQFKKG